MIFGSYKKQTVTGKKKRSYRLGMMAEYYAAFYMLLRGYKILAWRFKQKTGEIDLIFRKKDVIVFAEVKYRQTLEMAASSVSPQSQKRIINTAQIFLNQYRKKHIKKGRKGDDFVLRFDVIALSSYFKIRHIPNAFGEHACKIF